MEPKTTDTISTKIPKNVMICSGSDVNDARLRTAYFTNDQVDEDAIYQLTKAIMENTEAAEAIYAPAADYCLETQKESIDSYPLPIHPGAEKYYREAGLIQ